jgi:Bacterial Ig domain
MTFRSFKSCRKDIFYIFRDLKVTLRLSNSKASSSKNKFTMKLTTLFLIASLFFTYSCHKSGTDAPTLSVAAPLGDDQFTSGQPITIKGETTDVNGLHSLKISITDDKTKAVLYAQSPPVLNLKTYAFNAVWTAKVSDWTDATVTITAINHANIEVTKTIKIKIWL